MLGEEVLRGVHEFEANKLESSVLESLNDLSDKSALDTVWLNHDEGSFLVGLHGL